jgi:galactose mutarotase-like enzyme
MSPHLITAATTIQGFPTLTLACPEVGIDATFAPGIVMICCSLRHRGVELLGQRGGLAKYAESGSTMGIPLLHPWANRLSGDSYTVAGRTVRLDPKSPRVHRDGGGRPMHGLVLGYRGWTLVARQADETGARITAVLDFAQDAQLLAAFPFPHTLALEIELRGAALAIAATLRATGKVAVPVAFGFHPYLRLPEVPRDQWHVEMPVGRRLRLDHQGIPTGESEAVLIEPGRLEERTFDDLFTDLPRPAGFVLAGGGRRIAVEFGEGYPFVQIYAPDTDAVICFEPMTAPTNALVADGPALHAVPPGGAYRAAFSIHVA